MVARQIFRGPGGTSGIERRVSKGDPILVRVLCGRIVGTWDRRKAMMGMETNK